jgi:acyl-CoA synthetase (AMP-forming)/AMP-acid ligase II
LKRAPYECTPGAAPLSDEVNQKLFSLFPEAHIGQGYGMNTSQTPSYATNHSPGMTETCTVTSIWSIERKRGFSGGAGQLVPGVIARIVKTDRTLGGYNDVGELVVKAPSNALGYYNNAQAYVVSWRFTHPLNKITQQHEGNLRRWVIAMALVGP